MVVQKIFAPRFGMTIGHARQVGSSWQEQHDGRTGFETSVHQELARGIRDELLPVEGRRPPPGVLLRAGQGHESVPMGAAGARADETPILVLNWCDRA
ncbi:hypothetical protein BSN85_08365 [Bradyrhizobium brasilense]|nr:hypothetical protein BSN85_08365 [Bradyrhizobium brasilense]